MAQKKLLRVLYTVNGSPQYILARSYSQVQVTLIPPTGTSQHDVGTPNGVQELHCLYASVSLKTCLDTVCRSSPELTHDTTRDFSLYVLDPLESSSAPAPVQINNSNKDKCQLKNVEASAEPRGVAVGLGLMSWALATDDNDSAQVVGTLVKQPNGQDALEVIFALREVCIDMEYFPSSLKQGSCADNSHEATRMESTTAIITAIKLAGEQFQSRSRNLVQPT
jgi:hypothetical protein